MNKEQILALQTKLHLFGLYDGKLDGIWGNKSENALNKLLLAYEHTNSIVIPKLAFGKLVSSAFKRKIISISHELLMPSDGANWLMACIAWESGESFSPSIRNRAGSGAVGLIQFMPATAKSLGTTTEFLVKLSAEQQLDYVLRYFLPYKGKLQSLSDTYMAILWPKAAGKPEDYVLWSYGTKPITYTQNKGLDVDKNEVITKGEASYKVLTMLKKGLTEALLG